MKQRYSYLLFLFSAFCLLMAQSSYAQNYPDRTIKIIVPFATGGPTDIMARVIGQKLTAAWGQSVAVSYTHLTLPTN